MQTLCTKVMLMKAYYESLIQTIVQFKFYFQKYKNKENKYMYTNTIKIEYVLYKICTAVVQLKTSPIWSFCP